VFNLCHILFVVSSSSLFSILQFEVPGRKKMTAQFEIKADKNEKFRSDFENK